MLVIRRRPGQAIWIGDSVRIEIVEIAGNRVKLGIAAPPDVTVLRDEIRLTGQANQEAARAISRSGFAALLEHVRRAALPREESGKILPP